jgi:hypothetical protein
MPVMQWMSSGIGGRRGPGCRAEIAGPGPIHHERVAWCHKVTSYSELFRYAGQVRTAVTE